MVLREEFDADRHEERVFFSRVSSGDKRFALNCSLCSEKYYTDQATFDRLINSIEETDENPFVCEECQQEYDELEYSSH
jgi:hypothetical protein